MRINGVESARASIARGKDLTRRLKANYIDSSDKLAVSVDG